jgi:hypothetical protein
MGILCVRCFHTLGRYHCEGTASCMSRYHSPNIKSEPLFVCGKYKFDRLPEGDAVCFPFRFWYRTNSGIEMWGGGGGGGVFGLV